MEGAVRIRTEGLRVTKEGAKGGNDVWCRNGQCQGKKKDISR
jgi:hypothetical protein